MSRKERHNKIGLSVQQKGGKCSGGKKRNKKAEGNYVGKE